MMLAPALASHRAFQALYDPSQPRAKDGKWAQVGGRALAFATMKNGERVGADGGPLPAHIQELKLPPAWTDVVYDPGPEGIVLAKGKDSKGRAQYVYNKKHVEVQAAAKYARAQEMEAKYDKMYRQNEANRRNPTTRENAECLKLIMETGIRPGSSADTGAAKKAFGATTLEGRHVVRTSGGGVELHFTGKKGVDLKIPVDNPDTAKMLLGRAKKAGQNGQLFNTSNGTLLAYTHTLDGGGFKTKDFRTYIGTSTAKRLVASMPAPKGERAYRKAVREVGKAVSRKLGNTPTVALASYVDPTVFAGWRMGT